MDSCPTSAWFIDALSQGVATMQSKSVDKSSSRAIGMRNRWRMHHLQRRMGLTANALSTLYTISDDTEALPGSGALLVLNRGKLSTSSQIPFVQDDRNIPPCE